MLMTTVQVPSATNNNLQIFMHTSMSNIDISLSRIFQNNPSGPTCAHGFIDNVNNRKHSSNHKWGEREYHVQGSKYVQPKSDKNCFNAVTIIVIFWYTCKTPWSDTVE